MMAAININPGSEQLVHNQYRGSPNQQSLILECSICAEQYGLDFDHQTRSLRCGHSFCTKCLMKIMTPRGIKCPMCSATHSLPRTDVTLVPINYAVQDIVKNVAGSEQKKVSTKMEVPSCGVCKVNPAVSICIDCDPGKQFKFCGKCDTEEHTRPFGPAQRHRRFLIDQPHDFVTAYMSCSRHTQMTASLYSESLNEFACSLCTTEEDWSLRSVKFDLIADAAKRMRVKVQRLTVYTNDTVMRMGEFLHNLDEMMKNLEPSSMTVKADISRKFSMFIEILQERQRTLLSFVEVELKNRMESLKKQHKAIVSSNDRYRDAYESLNSLISKSDIDFLLTYHAVTGDVEPLLKNEDSKELLRPLVSQDIPFYVSKEVERQITTLGAVGGGLTPTDLECSPSGKHGTMIELLWQLPEDCEKLSRFQVEYEQVLDTALDRRHSGYIQNDPVLYEIPGNMLNAFVDYLSPGYTYRFRIRSANDAGVGMWSDPVIGTCTDFPFVLNYTKKIHRIRIPTVSHYRITVKGAKGADGMIFHGGKGAIISAVVALKAGDVLIILCGGMSSKHHYNSGGGGGSFVALNEISQDTLLIAAGGGGGTRGADKNDFDGLDASIHLDGLDGVGENFGRGGKDGGSGEDALDKTTPSWGCGGAGFMQDSNTASSFISGGHAGQNGGFGGGGAVGMYGGGGGGGYSGGGGGRGGGGGGSYVISTAFEVTKEIGCEDHGSICIERVSRSYPVTYQRTVSTIASSASDSPSLYNGGSSVGGRSSGGGGMSLVHLASQTSSSDSSNSVSSRVISSNDMSITTIPESDSIHQSPSSTSQVIDNQPGNIVPAMFSLDLNSAKYQYEEESASCNSSTVVSTEIDIKDTNATTLPTVSSGSNFGVDLSEIDVGKDTNATVLPPASSGSNFTTPGSNMVVSKDTNATILPPVSSVSSLMSFSNAVIGGGAGGGGTNVTVLPAGSNCIDFSLSTLESDSTLTDTVQPSAHLINFNPSATEATSSYPVVSTSAQIMVNEMATMRPMVNEMATMRPMVNEATMRPMVNEVATMMPPQTPLGTQPPRVVQNFQPGFQQSPSQLTPDEDSVSAQPQFVARPSEFGIVHPDGDQPTSQWVLQQQLDRERQLQQQHHHQQQQHHHQQQQHHQTLSGTSSQLLHHPVVTQPSRTNVSPPLTQTHGVHSGTEWRDSYPSSVDPATIRNSNILDRNT